MGSSTLSVGCDGKDIGIALDEYANLKAEDDDDNDDDILVGAIVANFLNN